MPQAESDSIMKPSLHFRGCNGTMLPHRPRCGLLQRPDAADAVFRTIGHPGIHRDATNATHRS